VIYVAIMDFKTWSEVGALTSVLALANGYRSNEKPYAATVVIRPSGCVPINGDPVAQLCKLFNDVNSGEPFFVSVVSS
jgi:hypothetical protein